MGGYSNKCLMDAKDAFSPILCLLCCCKVFFSVKECRKFHRWLYTVCSTVYYFGV